jgi:hypothetical protein
MDSEILSWDLDVNSTSAMTQSTVDAYIKNACIASTKIDSIFALDMSKKTYGIIEKYVYDIAMFHFQRLQVNMDANKHVTFWFKTTECLKCKNMHVDKDKYESFIYKTHNLKPILSCITYLTDNNNPTVISNIDKDSYNARDFTNNNTNLCFSFPRKNKHVSFDGGKYYHGELGLYPIEYGDERHLMVINLWDSEVPPMKIPFFNESIYSYIIYTMTGKPIKEVVIPKEESFIGFRSTTSNTMKIQLTAQHYQYISFKDFLRDIFYGNANKMMSNFLTIFENDIPSRDGLVIFDLSTIHSSYKDLNLSWVLDANVKKWDIKFCIHHEVANRQLQSLANYLDISNHIKTTFLLNPAISDYSIIEKYVYDIAMFHLKRLNIEFTDNKYIEFWFRAKKTTDNYMHFDSDEYKEKVENQISVPFLTCITYLNDSDNPTIISNINREDLSSGNGNGNNNDSMCISFPRKYKHISFDGGNYYHGEYNMTESSSSMMSDDRYTLVINLWNCAPPLHVPYYNNDFYSFFIFQRTGRPFDSEKFQKSSELFAFQPSDQFLTISVEDENAAFQLDNDSRVKCKFADPLKISTLLSNVNMCENDMIVVHSCQKTALSVDRPMFLQNDFYSPDICKEIITEYNKSVYSKSHTICINPENIPTIFRQCLLSFESICKHLHVALNVDTNEQKYNIDEIILYKHTSEFVCFFPRLCDNQCLVNIFLNENLTEFTGGEIFSSYEKVELLETPCASQNNTMIYTSKKTLYMQPMSRGERYILTLLVSMI